MQRKGGGAERGAWRRVPPWCVLVVKLAGREQWWENSHVYGAEQAEEMDEASSLRPEIGGVVHYLTVGTVSTVGS